MTKDELLLFKSNLTSEGGLFITDSSTFKSYKLVTEMLNVQYKNDEVSVYFCVDRKGNLFVCINETEGDCDGWHTSTYFMRASDKFLQKDFELVLNKNNSAYSIKPCQNINSIQPDLINSFSSNGLYD